MCATIRYDNASQMAERFRGNQYNMDRSLNNWKDRLGIIASVACAVHCAATPILLACLPALTFTEMMASARFHQVAAVVCVAMVSLAIWPNFRKFRDYRVLSLSTAGVGLLISAAFFLPDECCSHSLASVSGVAPQAGHNHANPVSFVEKTEKAGHSHTALASLLSPELIALVQPWMTPMGGVLLVLAHGMNIRLRVCKRSRCNCKSNATSLGAVARLAVTTKAA